MLEGQGQDSMQTNGTPRLLGDSQEARPFPVPGVSSPGASPEAVRENLTGTISAEVAEGKQASHLGHSSWTCPFYSLDLLI